MMEIECTQNNSPPDADLDNKQVSFGMDCGEIVIDPARVNISAHSDDGEDKENRDDEALAELKESFETYRKSIYRLSQKVRFEERDGICDVDSAVKHYRQPGRRIKSIYAGGSKSKDLSQRYAAYCLRVKVFTQLMCEPKLISFAASLIVLSVVITGWRHSTHEADSFNKTHDHAVGVISQFIVFTIVCRTRNCYSRWWMARSRWGQLTCQITNLSRQAASWICDKELRDRFLSYCIVFPYACKAVLRGNDFSDPKEEGQYLVQNKLISSKEFDNIRKNYTSYDCACLDMMWIVFNKSIYKPNALISDAEGFKDAVAESMEKNIHDLAEATRALYDLKITQMPITYNFWSSLLIIIFVIYSNMNWATSLGWAAPLMTGFVTFVMIVIKVVGDGMLDSFGLNLASLPLQKYCVSIEKEIMDISYRSEKFRIMS